MKKEFYKEKEQQEYSHYVNRHFDLNCDLAQGWGPYKYSDHEETLLSYVSSVNISCGAHAGDPALIMNALKMSKEKGLAIGAHIGYPDLVGFGRREMRLDPDELNACISSQLGFLAGIAKSQGVTLTHCRPHGALYHKCASDTVFAEQLAKTIAHFSAWLTFVIPAGTYTNSISEASGLKVVGEVHLDRLYRKDGNLYKFTPLRQISYDSCLSQARSLIYQNKLITEGGRRLKVSFKTIHLSSSQPYSLDLAQAVKNMLNQGCNSLDNLPQIQNLQPFKDLEPVSSLNAVWHDGFYS